jgi:AraC-like DNA-binding protein
MLQKRRTTADEVHFAVRSMASDFKAASVLPLHAHDWHQLIYVSAGLMSVSTEVGSWVAPASWAIWVPADMLHGIRFVRDSAFRTVYFRPDWADSAPKVCTVIAVSPLLRELVLRTIEIGQLDRRDATETCIATLMVSELRQSGTRALDLRQPTGTAMCRAAQLMAGGEPRAATVASLARAVGLGTRTFERRFFAETGMTPGRWRQQQAFLAGLEQLAIGASIKSVAAQAGYATASAFIAAFRKNFGTSPGNYFDKNTKNEGSAAWHLKSPS